MIESRMNSSQTLWYDKPASSWEEALPIGNGFMGGMVYGGIDNERIDLNEDTLWSGFARDTNNYDAIRHLEQVRDLIFKKEYQAAEEIVERYMLGPWHECYLPLGSLDIQHKTQVESASAYERVLDLTTGVATTVYSIDGATYSREVFMSTADHCMVMRLTSSKPEGISIVLKLDSQLKHDIEYHAGSSTFRLLGQCPSHVEPNYIEDHPHPIIYEEGKGLRFVTAMKWVTDQGNVLWNEHDSVIEIRNADAVTIFISAATDYSELHSEGYDRDLNLKDLVQSLLDHSSKMTYEALKTRHTSEFEALSTRVELSLEHTDISELSTDRRLQAVNQGARDPELAALYFHYGRYLLISSSRAGSQPASLQGIWSREIRAPWGSNWTTNINVQMNYWHAETTNLAECHQPLLAWIKRLAQKGKRTALIHYQCRGWAAHHNVDIWMDASPANGQAVWAFWPMAGAWLCSHLWEHYCFNQDEIFLKQEAFPIMKEAALFYLDGLISDNETGYLITNPSTSPENKFITPDGEPCAISKAATMDLVLIRELFTQCIAAIEVLNQDYEFALQLKEAISKLHPLQIGSDGRLQEWIYEYEEWEPGHRHLSHLYGMYPGSSIQMDRHIELSDAVRKSLEYRMLHSGGRTGWSCAWAMALWARQRDGERAHDNLLALYSNSTFMNLFDGHPYMVDTRIDYTRSIFQIDGNFGTTAAIAEMLLQSHTDEILLLPALPAAWSNGKVRGLRARGGVTVDMEWHNGQMTEVHLESDRGGCYRVRSAVPLKTDMPIIHSVSTHNSYQYEIQLPAHQVVSMRALQPANR